MVAGVALPDGVSGAATPGLLQAVANRAEAWRGLTATGCCKGSQTSIDHRVGTYASQQFVPGCVLVKRVRRRRWAFFVQVQLWA